jgi:hypothetical protein
VLRGPSTKLEQGGEFETASGQREMERRITSTRFRMSSTSRSQEISDRTGRADEADAAVHRPAASRVIDTAERDKLRRTSDPDLRTAGRNLDDFGL